MRPTYLRAGFEVTYRWKSAYAYYEGLFWQTLFFQSLWGLSQLIWALWAVHWSENLCSSALWVDKLHTWRIAYGHNARSRNLSCLSQGQSKAKKDGYPNELSELQRDRLRKEILIRAIPSYDELAGITVALSSSSKIRFRGDLWLKAIVEFPKTLSSAVRLLGD